MVQVSRKSSKKKLLLLISAVLLFIVLLVAVLEKTNVINLFSTPASDTSESGPTPEEIAQEEQANADAKQEYLDDTYKDKDDEPAPLPPSDPSLTVTAKQEGSSVTVLTKIQSVAEGNCTLTITNGAKTITQKAAVIYQPEFSSCAGFGVPISELGSGTWAIKLTVTPTGGNAISKTTTLEVK
jgi:cytoskeletal protein RodZ